MEKNRYTFPDGRLHLTLLDVGGDGLGRRLLLTSRQLYWLVVGGVSRVPLNLSWKSWRRVYNLLRTDRNGWIEVSTDGERMWVEAAR